MLLVSYVVQKNTQGSLNIQVFLLVQHQTSDVIGQLLMMPAVCHNFPCCERRIVFLECLGIPSLFPIFEDSQCQCTSISKFSNHPMYHFSLLSLDQWLRHDTPPKYYVKVHQSPHGPFLITWCYHESVM